MPSALLLHLYAQEYLRKFVGSDIFTILQLVLISQIILLCLQGMGNGMGKKHRDRKLSIKMQLGSKENSRVPLSAKITKELIFQNAIPNP